MSDPTTPQPPQSPEPGSAPTWGTPGPQPQYGGAPQYGSAPPYPSAPPPASGSVGLSAGPLAPDAERGWAVGAHLSGFVAAWFALGFLGPLTVLLVAGNRSAYVRRNAVEALNFNLSVLIYVAVSAILVIVGIGILMLAGIAVLYTVASIIGAVAASRGQEYRYPVTIRFIR